MKHILNTSWRDLADFFYEGAACKGIPQKNCVIFCHTDQLPLLFADLKWRSNKYIVISADSDYGVCLQGEEPIAGDMNKWLKFAQFDEANGYAPMVIPTRCQSEACKISDELSLKMYTWTKETFNSSDVPNSIVKLLVTNWTAPFLSAHRLVRIPFGISHTMESVLKKQEEKGSNKTDNLYVNFSFNTIERYEMYKAMQFFGYPKIEMNVSQEQFAESLAGCKAALCMEGNGKDSYRILESLYLKTVPIICTGNNDSWVDAYKKLPLQRFKGNNLNALNSLCLSTFKNYGDYNFNLDGTEADLSFWEETIQLYKRELL